MAALPSGQSDENERVRRGGKQGGRGREVEGKGEWGGGAGKGERPHGGPGLTPTYNSGSSYSSSILTPDISHT